MKIYWVNYTARDNYGQVIANGNIVGRSEKLNIQCMNNWSAGIKDSVQRGLGRDVHSVTIDAVIPLPDEDAA